MTSEEFQGREGEYDPQMTLDNNVKDLKHGLAIGTFNTGECDDAYILQVALPGFIKDITKLSVDIKKTGKVVIEGHMVEPQIFLKSELPQSLGVIMQELTPIGPFTLTYFFPGVVDPRLCQLSLEKSGVLNIAVMKDVTKKDMPGQSRNNN